MCWCNHVTDMFSAPTYKDLRINGPLSQAYADEMAHIGEKIIVRQDECFTASTDMGNVSYAVPR